MKKILPTIYPPITSYPSVAGTVGIMMLYTDYKHWFCENFIQLYVNKHNELKIYDYKCPFITAINHNEKLKKLSPYMVLEFIKELINTNSFLWYFLDRYYVNKDNPNNRHYLHNTMIYGYDDNEKLIYICDFFGANNQFEYGTISYRDFILATKSIDKNNLFYYGMSHLLVQEKIDVFPYKLKLETILQQLSDYKKSINTTATEDALQEIEFGNGKWGLSIYPWLADKIANFDDDSSRINPRLLYILCDHKRAMIYRINFLAEQKLLPLNIQLLERMQKALDISTGILNMALKYNITRQRNILKRLEEQVYNLMIFDDEVTEEFIDILKKHNE